MFLVNQYKFRCTNSFNHFRNRECRFSQEDIFSPENLYLCSRKAARRIQLVRLPLENAALSINFDRGRPEILTSHCTVFQYIPSFSFFLSLLLPLSFFVLLVKQRLDSFQGCYYIYSIKISSWWMEKKKKRNEENTSAKQCGMDLKYPTFQLTQLVFSKFFSSFDIYIYIISRHHVTKVFHARFSRLENVEFHRKGEKLFIVWAWKGDETT